MYLLSLSVGGDIGPHKSPNTKSSGASNLDFACCGNGALLCFPIKHMSQMFAICLMGGIP